MAAVPVTPKRFRGRGSLHQIDDSTDDSGAVSCSHVRPPCADHFIPVTENCNHPGVSSRGVWAATPASRHVLRVPRGPLTAPANYDLERPGCRHGCPVGPLRREFGFAISVLCVMSHVLGTSQDACQSGQMLLHSARDNRGLLGLKQGEADRNFARETGRSLSKLIPSPTVMVSEAGGIDREQIRKELFQSLQLSGAERIKVSMLEQGSQEWLDARKNRLTGSNFGAAVGHNKYKSPAALAHDMLYGTFKGNDATRWGNDHEDLACQEYCLARRSQLEREAEGFEFTVTHSGLNAHPTMNWLAVSPDGHVKENGVDGLLEIKCPYSQRIYPEIPPYYMDQIQGGMGVLGLPWADFCIWTPHSMQIQRVQFDRGYWEDQLKPGLEQFFHSVFVPAYVDREVRRLHGDLSVPRAPR